MINRRRFNHRLLNALALAAIPGLPLATTANTPEAYGLSSTISSDIYVADAEGRRHRLAQLIRDQGREVCLVYLFGGGAMGAKRNFGGIWCSDSYEDLHILRTLSSFYKDRVGFIAVAVPAVFHTHYMGYPERVFLDYPDNSEEFQRAESAFVESTLAAVGSNKTLPFEPYFDTRFRLLMSAEVQASLKRDYGHIEPWQGVFRSATETQSYGVPAIWLADSLGEVLTEPFRSNIYHSYEGSIDINYSVNDLIAAIEAQL